MPPTQTVRHEAAAAVVELVAAHPQAPHGARWQAAVEVAVPAVQRLITEAGVRVTSRERPAFLVFVLRDVAPDLDRGELAAALRSAAGEGWRSPRPSAGMWGAWLVQQTDRTDAVGDLARLVVAELGPAVPNDLAAVVRTDGVGDLGDAFATAMAEWGARVTGTAAYGWSTPDGIYVACQACGSWHLHGRATTSLEFRVSHCPVDAGAYSVVLLHPSPFNPAWSRKSLHFSRIGRRALGDIAQKENQK